MEDTLQLTKPRGQALLTRLLRLVTGNWTSRVAPWWIRRRLGSKTMSDHQLMLQSIS